MKNYISFSSLRNLKRKKNKKVELLKKEVIAFIFRTEPRQYQHLFVEKHHK